MISPRRSLDYTEGFEKKTSVDLLERKVQESYDEFVDPFTEENGEQACRLVGLLFKIYLA